MKNWTQNKTEINGKPVLAALNLHTHTFKVFSVLDSVLGWDSLWSCQHKCFVIVSAACICPSTLVISPADSSSPGIRMIIRCLTLTNMQNIQNISKQTQINVGDNKRGMHWPSLFSHLEVVWERKNSFCKSLAGFIKKEYTSTPIIGYRY